MPKKRHSNDDIYKIDYLRHLDERMTLRDWIKLTWIRWTNRERYDRWYDLIWERYEIEDAFEISKIKEHEYIF